MSEHKHARQPVGQFPRIRMRRNRAQDWSRRLVAENRLSADDFIWPVFVKDGGAAREPVAAMPGVDRLTIPALQKAAEKAAKLGIPAIAIFPFVPPEKKSEDGAEAYRAKNVCNRAIAAIKQAVPEIGVMCDVALDPYTSHGHDGLLQDGVILNDETLDVLVKQALSEAEAGVDVVAPSDMMDGRVGRLRDALDASGFQHVKIMSYAAKYASGFYGPFREAIGSKKALKGDKRTYQMDPANGDEALRELSRRAAPGEAGIQDADLRLSGLRGVFDDQGRRRQRLDGKRARGAGDLAVLQARRRRRDSHLLGDRGC
jgi:porphobilinogen synthase